MEPRLEEIMTELLAELRSELAQEEDTMNCGRYSPSIRPTLKKSATGSTRP